MRACSIAALFVLAACGPKKVATTAPPGGDDDSATPTPVEGEEQTYGGNPLYVDLDDEPPPEREPEPPQPPSLMGVWVSPCDLSQDGKAHHRLSFDFTEERWSLDIEQFTDAACAKRSFAVHIGGAYQLGEASAAVPGAWNAFFAIDARTLTADDKATAKKLGKTCGVKLAAKKALDIQAKGCAGLGLLPADQCAGEYDLAAVNGDQLQFGARPADNNLCTEDRRTTALSELDLRWRWKSFGLADCDAYAEKVTAFRTCDKLPQAARDAVFEGLKAMFDGFVLGDIENVPEDVKAQTSYGCQTAVEALTQTMTANGC